MTFFDITKPNLAALQTAFTGRLYSVDMFVLYRAVSGEYPTYPSVIAGGVGLSLQQDLVTFAGAFGPVGRFHWVGDTYSAIYNDQIERDVRPLGVVAEGFWPAWARYTELLREDADAVGAPFKAPLLPFDTSLPKLELDPSGLDLTGRFIYGVYRGDVDSMEILLRMLLQYLPETAVTIPLFKRDLDGIFALYAEWARERFLGEPASPGARILSKVILLADYRWYLLLGDLLSLFIEPTFRQPAFSDGISRLGTMMRVEAERIVLA